MTLMVALEDTPPSVGVRPRHGVWQIHDGDSVVGGA